MKFYIIGVLIMLAIAYYFLVVYKGNGSTTAVYGSSYNKFFD